jgi:hypothetical protein
LLQVRHLSIFGRVVGECERCDGECPRGSTVGYVSGGVGVAGDTVGAFGARVCLVTRAKRVRGQEWNESRIKLSMNELC